MITDQLNEINPPVPPLKGGELKGKKLLGDEAYSLRPGDSITFPSTFLHLVVNPTRRKGKTIWVNSIPWIFQNR